MSDYIDRAMAKIFISFASGDSETASDIAGHIRDSGHDPWIYPDEMQGGQRVWNTISNEIRTSEAFVVLISSRSEDSKWVDREVSYAVSCELERGGVLRCIVPVLIENVAIESALKDLAHITQSDPEIAAQEIIAAVERSLSSAARRIKKNCILVVGSGLVEDILSIDREHEIDSQFLRVNSKYIAEKREKFFGGSGVNFFSRLCAAENYVTPIVSAGMDDQGENIQKWLLGNAETQGYPKVYLDFISSNEFLCRGLFTSETVVISIKGSSRMTLTPALQGFRCFPAHLRSRLKVIECNPEFEVDSVMIGHIHADAPMESELEPERDDTDKVQTLTHEVVDKYHRNALVFANFGSSQLSRGCEFWKADLQRLSVIQFSLPEVFDFFREDYPNYSLLEIIRWFMDNHITAVITHDRFGIIGTHNARESKDKVVIADPFYIGEIEDKTGAGDAFGSGLVHELRKRGREFSFYDFVPAIDTARRWAAYACMDLGSSKNCPTAKELAIFVSARDPSDIGRVQVRDLNEVRWYLRVIELTIRR